MRVMFLTLLLLASGCTSYYNPSLPVTEDRSARFKQDRDECRERSQKIAHSAPKNDIRRLKTYAQEQDEYAKEVRAFDNCMAAKGWIKK